MPWGSNRRIFRLATPPPSPASRPTPPPGPRSSTAHLTNHAISALSGPQDELKDLADTVDGLLARLEAHVVEQQRFAANASHELRTPLAITQTLLEVARNDPRVNSNDDVDG